MSRRTFRVFFFSWSTQVVSSLFYIFYLFLCSISFSGRREHASFLRCTHISPSRPLSTLQYIHKEHRAITLGCIAKIIRNKGRKKDKWYLVYNYEQTVFFSSDYICFVVCLFWNVHNRQKKNCCVGWLDRSGSLKSSIAQPNGRNCIRVYSGPKATTHVLEPSMYSCMGWCDRNVRPGREKNNWLWNTS